MKHFSNHIIAIFISLLSSCNGKDLSVTQIIQNGNPLMVMNLKSTRDSTVIKLTDIATDLRFIHLETIPECLISHATYYITDKYILAKTKTGIYQFDHKGKFIRTLVTKGEGPREFEAAEWVVDDKNETMILADEQKSGYFMHFDLKSGDYLGDIPKAVQGVTRRFSLTDYGSLACVPFMLPGNHPDQFYMYWQDLKGNLTDTLKGPANLAIMRDNYFEPLPDGYRCLLAYTNKDTIYTVRNKTLIPFLAFNHGEDVPESMETFGYRTMRITIETDRYLFLNKLQITNVMTSGNHSTVTWDANDYLVDKTQKKAFLIAGIYNDFIGALQQTQTFNILPNNQIYNALQALELIGIAERAIENPKSDQKLIGRMTNLLDQISRDDNPVLLVGRVRGSSE
ncbi:MAG: 6-bladed beta-propeller [Bacteroidia bacterium]|nr:6-bladed beta-propeller [Bacteroidia bacterium]